MLLGGRVKVMMAAGAWGARSSAFSLSIMMIGWASRPPLRVKGVVGVIGLHGGYECWSSAPPSGYGARLWCSGFSNKVRRGEISADFNIVTKAPPIQPSSLLIRLLSVHNGARQFSQSPLPPNLFTPPRIIFESLTNRDVRLYVHKVIRENDESLTERTAWEMARKVIGNGRTVHYFENALA